MSTDIDDTTSESTDTSAEDHGDAATEPGAPDVPESHGADDDHDEHHPKDTTFIKVFFFLAAVTALEVAISYIDIGSLFLPLLLGLMAVKFFTVVLVFMHVKYDAKIFGRLFYFGLALAVIVYVVMLMTFLFFDS